MNCESKAAGRRAANSVRRPWPVACMLAFSAIVCISCAGGPVPVNNKKSGGDDGDKSTSHSNSTPSSDKFKGKRYALLVGIRKYDSKEFPDLMYSEKDVEDLAQAMGKAGYSDSNIVLMTSKSGDKNSALKPEPLKILAKLTAIAKNCTDQDVLFIGFAGHGFQKSDPSNPGKKKQYFCCAGAMQEGREDALIDFDDVYKVLRDCRAGLKLVIVDACRNSATRDAPPPMKPGFSSVTASSVPPGVMAFFSCSEGQRSYESDALQNGVFFHFVIEAFQGKAGASNGQLTRFGLGEYLDQNVDHYVHDVLKLDRHQRWDFKGETNVSLPLAETPRSAGGSRPKGGDRSDPNADAANAAKLEPSTVMLKGSHNFNGCEVFIDEKLKFNLSPYYGGGPELEDRMTPGEHKLVVKKNGVVIHTSTVDVKPPSEGKTYYLVKLDLIHNITLQTQFPVVKGVWIYLDDKEIKEWPAGFKETEVSTEVGLHVVVIKGADGRKYQREILVEPGKPNTIDFSKSDR